MLSSSPQLPDNQTDTPQKQRRKGWLGWFRVFAWVIIGFLIAVLGFGVLATVTLRQPVVQGELVRYLAKLTKEHTGFAITVESLDFNLYDELIIQNLIVYDLEGNRMLELPHATVGVSLRRIFRREVALDAIYADSGRVTIINSKKLKEVNVSRFVEALSAWIDPDTTPSKNPANFHIYRGELTHFELVITDEKRDSIKPGFDYYHMRFTDVWASVENFRTRADTLEVLINHLKAQDKHTQWVLHRAEGFFRMTKNNMNLAPMRMWVGHSYLADSVQFQYAAKRDLADFVEKVTIAANLRKSRIDYRDLALFAPALRPISDSIRVLRGKVHGKVGDLSLTQVSAKFGFESEVVGKVRLVGLPKVENLRLDLALRPSYLLPEDMHPYVPKAAQVYLDRLGPTDLEGTYKGTLTDFTAKGGIYGRNGTLKTDLTMHIKPGDKSSYEGTFTAEDLALGTLLEKKPLFGTVSGSGQVSGHGFSLEKAKMALKADLSRFDLNRYPYHNVSLDATLALGQFDGVASVQDSNLIADANGIIDLNRKRQFFDVETNVRRARLQKLGWVPDDIEVAGRASLNGAGSNADNAEGILRIDDADIKYNKKPLHLSHMEFETWIEARSRSLRLASDYANGTLDGNFTFRTLAQDLEAALNDYGRIFHNEKALANTTALYSKYPYSASLKMDLSQMTPVLRLFIDGVQLAPHAKLEADINKTSNLLLQGGLSADYMAYGNSVFDAVRADVATSKKLNENNILASGSITSSSQRFGNLMSKDLNLEGTWEKDRLDFLTSIHQDNDSNYIELEGFMGFGPGSVKARLEQARIRLLDSVWHVAPGNRIEFDGRAIHADSLSFTTKTQRVAIEGTAGPNPKDTLHLAVDSFSAAFAKAFLDGKFTGKTTARIDIMSLLSPHTELAGFMAIKDFERNHVPLGNITASLIPQPASKNLDLKIEISNGKQTLLGGSGTIRPTSLDQQMDLDFRLYSTPLTYLDPLFTGIISNWQGSATGRLNLTGNFGTPVLTGNAYIQDGGLTVDYLKARYFFEDSVWLQHGLIKATGAQLRDAQGHTGTLTKAEVRHRFFQDFYLDLQGDLNGLQLLNTTVKDNKLYYGAAYASGQLSIRGPVGDIAIGATVRTEKGTRLYLPLQTALAANTSRESFIRFVGASQEHKQKLDSLSKAKQDSAARNAPSLSGIRLNFNIELTQDAFGEIIFDKQTGDAVSAYGYGRIKLNIDTRGDFSMVGRYNMTQGSYKFTFANFINKSFAIKEGSSITWSGDPAAGIMDINAVYASTVPFTPLILGAAVRGQDSINLSSEAARRYPVNVNMHLTGPMLQPIIGLELDIPNQYPTTLSPYVTTLQSLITNNEQELNKQVFSLLLLRSLSPIGLNSYATAGNSVGNLTELLSNQLSAWLSEVNKNLEVGVNLSGFNQQSLDNFQLRVSYTALDGRLKVTRNGGFTNTSSQTTAASLAGDWTLEYFLTRDGKLRAKVFHRTNQTLANTGLGGTLGVTTSQGASLLHTQSFSSLRELFPWLYKRKKVETGTSLPLNSKPATKDLATKKIWLPKGSRATSSAKPLHPAALCLPCIPARRHLR